MIPEAVILQRQSQAKRELERMKNGRSALFAAGVREEYDLPYRGDGDPRHTLDLIRPAGEEPLPLIVEIHGGAYIACEKNINRLHARAFAQQGFCVVNGDYTLHPEGTFRQNMQELADILRWVEDNAAHYGMDVSRAYLSGDSAGGHLALLYTMIQSSESVRARFGTHLPGLRLRAAAATCPCFRLRYGEKEANDAAARQIVEMAFPDGVSEEELEELDVLKLIPEVDYPPLIVTATPGDTLLWQEDLILARALERRGRPFAFRAFERKTSCGTFSTCSSRSMPRAARPTPRSSPISAPMTAARRAACAITRRSLTSCSPRSPTLTPLRRRCARSKTRPASSSAI